MELNTKLPTMLQARISIQKYLYVKNDEVRQHVSLHYAAYLIQHPNLLPLSTNQGYFNYVYACLIKFLLMCYCKQVGN